MRTTHLLSYSSIIYHKSFDRAAELFLLSVANENQMGLTYIPPEFIRECRERLEKNGSLWQVIGHLAFDCEGLI
jgi:hypothetical protein